MTRKEQDLETDDEIDGEIFKNLPITLGAHSEPIISITRNEILEVNGAVINLLTQRLKGKRFRPQTGDVIRLGYIRALIQALQSYNEILKTNEIDEIEKKIDYLEQRLL
jgi:hypothetical protein